MQQSITTLIDLTTRAEFLGGLAMGIVALGLLLVTRLRLTSAYGELLTLALLAAVQLTIGRRLALTAGIVVLIAAGRLRGAPRTLTIAAGAAIVATRGGLLPEIWVMVGGVVMTLVTERLLVGLTRSPSLRSITGPLIAITAFGIWTTVPNTDVPRALVGVAIPLAAATMWGRTQLSPRGAPAIAATLAWAAAVGGSDRPGSIVGAWACLGLIALVPLIAQRLDLDAIRPAVTVILHLVLVGVAARFVGFAETAGQASLRLTALAVLALASMEISVRTATPA